MNGEPHSEANPDVAAATPFPTSDEMVTVTRIELETLVARVEALEEAFEAMITDRS